MRRATIASPEILEAHGADENNDSSGINIRGWSFRSSHGIMACEQDLINLQKYISQMCGVVERDDDVIVINGDHLHLPPMHFPKDILSIEHQASETQISYNASDCIACWGLQHKHPESMTILEVPYAKKWSDASLSSSATSTESIEGSGLKQHKWDWTYSTQYNCSLHFGSDSYGENFIAHSGGVLVSPTTGAVVMSSVPESSADVHSRQRGWTRCEAGGIDIEMLRAKDDILFFDEFMLYQDDLQDCGESTFEVKVRVMPKCWFVLSRLYLRVDGSTITLRETRVFHAFGADRVFMETSHKQGDERDFLLPNQSSPLCPPPGAPVPFPRAAAPGGVSPPSPLGTLPMSRPPPSMTTPMAVHPALAGVVHPPSVPPHPSLVVGVAGRPIGAPGAVITGAQLRDANHMSRILPVVDAPRNYCLYI